MIFTEWQIERLSEGFGGNTDIANASELQAKKVRDFLTDVATLSLGQTVDLILDTLDPNSSTDLVVRQAASLCLSVLCEEQPTEL